MKGNKAGKKAGNNMTKNFQNKHLRGGIAALGGIGAGALMMYLFDPQAGRGRRSGIKSKALSLSSDIRGTVGAAASGLGSRASGLAGQARSAVLRRGKTADDLSA
jgi:hypothetical protein